MSGRPTDISSVGPLRHRRGRRSVRRALAVSAALIAFTALTACRGATESAPTPVTPVATATLGKDDVDAWLDGMLPAALNRVGIAGAGVAVVTKGAVLTSRGYGWADAGTGGGERVPIDPARILFRPASVSKVVTATAVMQLVEGGSIWTPTYAPIWTST